MSIQELGISHKRINKILVAYVNFRGEIKEIPPKIDELYKKCKNYAFDQPLAIIDYGVYSEGGKDIDICIPISKTPEKEDIKTKYIDQVEVLSIDHHGSYDSLNESAQKLFNYLHTYGVLGTSWLRLVYHTYNLKNPHENEIEIQAVLH
ncbi:MAG: hypothetical protein ACFE75_12735, partial [Candidatus Hodarchaeota archaeon]